MTTKHGDARRGKNSVEYRCWANAIQRCNNPKRKEFHRYGGREISMCPRWRNNYAFFVSDMGRRPSRNHSLERTDNQGDYDPANCVWATHLEQCANRKNPAKKLTDGAIEEIKTLLHGKQSQVSIAAKFGVSQQTISEINTRKQGRPINRRRGCQKLTSFQVRKIRQLLRSGESHASIAEQFGVSRPTISLISANKTWRQ